MVLEQLIQTLYLDYWQIVNFILYFALFGIIVKEGLKNTPLKESASKLGVIVGLILAAAVSSFEFVKGRTLALPSFSLPRASPMTGSLYSFTPYIGTIMFALLAYLLIKSLSGDKGDGGYFGRETGGNKNILLIIILVIVFFSLTRVPLAPYVAAPVLGDIAPIVGLVMFVVLTKWLGEMFIGDKGKGLEKKILYYVLAAFIVFLLLGNVSPDLSGMVGASIATAIISLEKMFGPVLDLVFFGLFFWLLIELMKKVGGGSSARLGTEEREFRKKTGEEKEQEWVQKKLIKKEKDALKALEKGLKGLKDKSQIETLRKISELLGKIQYVTGEEAQKLADAILYEISNKIDKIKPDRKKIIENIKNEIEKLNKYANVDHNKINRSITEELNRLHKLVNEIENRLDSEKVEEIHNKIEEATMIDGYLNKVNACLNEYIRRLDLINQEIARLDEEFDTNINNLKTNISSSNFLDANTNCDEAIATLMNINSKEEEFKKISGEISKWREKEQEYFNALDDDKESIKRLMGSSKIESSIEDALKDIEEKEREIKEERKKMAGLLNQEINVSEGTYKSLVNIKEFLKGIQSLPWFMYRQGVCKVSDRLRVLVEEHEKMGGGALRRMMGGSIDKQRKKALSKIKEFTKVQKDDINNLIKNRPPVLPIDLSLSKITGLKTRNEKFEADLKGVTDELKTFVNKRDKDIELIEDWLKKSEEYGTIDDVKDIFNLLETNLKNMMKNEEKASKGICEATIKSIEDVEEKWRKLSEWYVRTADQLEKIESYAQRIVERMGWIKEKFKTEYDLRMER